MPPFRWPSMANDITLATEVAARRPSSSGEWDIIAAVLSEAFSTVEKPVDLSGRACRERLDRLLNKYKDEDKKSLKRSGTEEDFNELQQLLEDIYTFKRDQDELKQREKENKKHKEQEEHQKALAMRSAALSGMAKNKRNASNSDSSNSDIDDLDNEVDFDPSKKINEKKQGRKRKYKKRTSQRAALDILAEKYETKANLKDKELELRRMELEFQQKKYEDDAKEREAKMQLDLEERRLMISLLKDKL